jgi:nucleoside phosphorylase/CheY-like chemotaxis protein
MINILVLDDSEEKTSIILKFLIEECNINAENIKSEKNVKDGRKILYEKDFDLLLLDLVLPRDQESEPNADESIKFLEEIYYNSSIHIPVHIIGFSQFDELINAHHNKFDDKLWHLINFNYANSNWKDKLKSKVCYITSLKQRFKDSLESKNNYDIGIICALEIPEFKEILELNCSWKKISLENDPLVYYEGKINTINGNQFKIIACSINRMGMQATSSVSTKMIEKFNIKQLFMTGICAGIKERDTNYGDIIISENITDYGSGKMVENEKGDLILRPEPHQIPTEQHLISKLNSFLREDDKILEIQTKYKGNKPLTLLTAKIGPTTSGSYVVSSENLVNTITSQNRKLLAIDMEGYGMYLACHFFNKTTPLMIKSVCDFGDKHKGDDYQNYASFTSANFLYSFIFNML